MSDHISPQQFEHRKALESDVQKVSEEVARQKELPEHKEAPDEDLVRKSIQVLTATQANSQNAASTAGYLPVYTKDISPQMKLEAEHIIDIALSRGIEEATELAKNSGPFMVDVLHDVMTGKLYDELKKRGIAE